MKNRIVLIRQTAVTLLLNLLVLAALSFLYPLPAAEALSKTAPPVPK